MPNPSTSGNLLLTRVGKRRLAIDLDVVTHVVQAVAVTDVAGIPDDALGVVSIAGEITPVLTPRPLLGLDPCPVQVEDRLVLLRSPRGGWALHVNEVLAVLPAGEVAGLRPCPVAAHAAIRGMVDVLGEVVHLCDCEVLGEDAERARAKALESRF